MERMDRFNPEIERLFRAKEKRRTQLAAMPFHEKVRAVVQMQKMAAPLLRDRGIQVRIWELKPIDDTQREARSQISDLK
jgi:hypothetical protein